MNDKKYMQLAIDLSIKSIDEGGGPFGAVIVKNEEIIAQSYNTVTKEIDPTAHAEINAIRIAAKKLGTFDLSGCIIYSSCEPCPMCLGAIYWAKIDSLYFANTKHDAEDAGFSDKFIYEELEKLYERRNLKITNLMRDEAIKAFIKWNSSTNVIKY
jgi:tRNA(Arg) A34 adenosine deaminase TadA